MVYLIHFETKLSHAQHYIGWCADGDLQKRFRKHLKGQGANILAACLKAGIKFDIVRTYPGKDRTFERKLKNYHKSKQLCLICKSQPCQKK